ncbi:MAG: L,D-transpeptidase family protein [Lachnospiraceae bacterium]|nr:L,D-transpeptidase family protein [Lachnospiraceae bacterium]
MSRKAKIILVLVPTLLLTSVIGLYILLANYYKSGFSYGTWINGVYCTGKGIDEINLELKNKYETGSLKITDPDGKVSFIYPENVSVSVDFTDYLRDIKNKQNPYLWVQNLFKHVPKSSIEPDLSYDEDLLYEEIENLEFVKNNTRPDGHEVKIILTDEGYELYDDNIPRVDISVVKEAVRTAFFTTDEVTLDESCFYVEPYTDKEMRIMDEWESVSDYFTPKLTMDMGDEKITIDNRILSRFVTLEENDRFLRNEEGGLYISDSEIRSFVDDTCDRYDTYDKPRKYKAHNGKVYEIDKILYGTLVNRDAMYEYLDPAIKEGKKELYTPEYLHKAYHRGLDDIGPTYIEIDLEKQVLYYFRDGDLKMEADVVTGKPSSPTPPMVCCVFSKSTDVILRGTNYASHVNYWMPIYPTAGIGLHDASWQSAFGGDRYITHGSHGCVNMKNDDISVLYDEIEVGIPVILY